MLNVSVHQLLKRHHRMFEQPVSWHKAVASALVINTRLCRRMTHHKQMKHVQAAATNVHVCTMAGMPAALTYMAVQLMNQSLLTVTTAMCS